MTAERHKGIADCNGNILSAAALGPTLSSHVCGDWHVSDDGLATFEDCRNRLLGMQLSHLWRGHGSTIILEFGRLSPMTRLSGEPANPIGEIGFMIGWSWRIEDASSILCGSWSDDGLWEPSFARLRNVAATGLSLLGRLPEIAIDLAGGLHVLSFMTAEGGPQWVLFDRRATRPRTLRVIHGKLCVEDLEHEGIEPLR